MVGLYQQRSSAETDKYLTILLSELYGGHTGRAIKFLLDNASDDVRLRFIRTYLSPQSLARYATATIVVKPAAREERLTPNMGRFLVFLRAANGCETLLRFTNQASTVFYLMHLVDRKQKAGVLPPMDLRRNEHSFCALYHAVYEHRGEDDVAQRYRNLLYRVVGGQVRAGRKGAVISDIRRSLEQAFHSLSESFFPYAMTARSHLSVSPDRIVFEGGARVLLTLSFV